MKYKILLWYLLLPVLIILVTETIPAQTVIREKVSIKPQSRNIYSVMSADSLYTINLHVTMG